mmetsp:Transcript_7019/g.14727  ORF Transcript_7019/g.14727 Transcript_7019/m.14727 type:complete len:395 (-) Transcript_7019:205-1389(-)
MCRPSNEEKGANSSGGGLKYLTGFLGLSTIGLLAATIVLATKDDSSSSAPAPAPAAVQSVSNVPDESGVDTESVFMTAENTCMDKKLKFENVDCVHTPGPQAGANVTKGYKGGMEVDFVPNTANYWQSSMCPVNVHWHLGTEHYSVGEYDENGDGPHGNIPAPERRRLGGEDVRAGFRCHHYDKSDPKFTTEYEWKHCKKMEVGETYEVHWPHSAAGACGTPNQYQTPFYDGVFCNLDLETVSTLGPQDIANAVGVQAQIFTVVNDESYFYPDLIRGWVVDEDLGMGVDRHFYTGSTTGTSRNNEICSQYTPITWQVDRKCHMISASSFDKLCYDMKLQRDNMEDDLHAHGSRVLVKDSLVANNQQRRLNHHDHSHGHAHGHAHDHDHDHEEWF